LVDYLPSLLKKPVEFYSCFISYSSKDQDSAERLYTDLQNKGVRCWFAPQDLRIGAKTDTIDEAIRHRDKVLLILSQQAIASDWVEDEVNKAFAEERERKQTVLFPIRLDNAVMQTAEPWPANCVINATSETSNTGGIITAIRNAWNACYGT
jgi:TIR domain